MEKQKRQFFPSDKHTKRSVSFLIISLFVHFLFVLFFTEYSDFLAENTDMVKKPKEPEIQFVDVAEMDRLRGEIAELDKTNKKKAKDAKFLSEKDNAVEKETKAAQRGEFQNKKNIESKKTQASAPSQAQQEAAAPEIKAPDMQTFGHGDMAIPAKKPKKAQSISDLRVNTMQEMSEAKANDASQTNDYLKDVAIGAETHLNAREFLYYTYFNRIKKKLREHWEPLIHTRVRDMVRGGRHVATLQGAKTTRLVITLDDRGGLSRVQISTTSGLMDLDNVAIEALRVSAPFPNPPKDLIENGFVKINWDFILES